MSARRPVLFLIVLVLLALGFRLGLSWKLQGLDSPPDPNMGLDHIQYAWSADSMLQGSGYRLSLHENDLKGAPSAFRPPGTPWLLYGIYTITGQSSAPIMEHSPAFAAVRITFALLGCLTLIPIYVTARAFLPVERSLLATAILGFFPAHAYYGMHFFSEVPWTFLLSCAMALSVRLCKNPSVWVAVLQGLIIGYASLIRPIAFLYPFIQTGMLLLVHPNRKRLFPLGLLTCLVCFICLIPWGMRNHQQFDKWVFFTTHGGTTLYGCHNEKIMADPALKGRWLPPEQTPRAEWVAEGATEVERDDRAYEAAYQWIEENREQMPELILWKLIRTFNPHPGTPNQVFNLAVGIPWLIMIPFVLVGGFRMFKAPDRAWVAVLTPLALILLMTVVWYGDHRFRISIAPVWILLAVIGATGSRKKKKS